MSPLGRALLIMCDNDLIIDVDSVMPWFPLLNREQIRFACLQLGLTILGGS